MKRIIVTLTLFFLLCSYVFAGVTVKSGNKKFFKTASGNAVLEFIWDGATFNNTQPLTEKFTELETLKPVAWTGFVEEFNEACKTVKVIEDVSNAKYQISMKVTNMDQYFKVMGFIPGNATKVWGTLTITEIETGNEIVVFDVEEIDGGANPSPDGSFSDCFEALGKSILKAK